MSAAHLQVERSEGIVACRISNPPHHTLTAAGVGELHALLDELEADRELRVLVLSGGGEGVFIAHYEVGELAEGAERAVQSGGDRPRSSDLHPMHQLCLRLERMSAITIAALNGSAAGGGLELALACDFRLAADGPFLFGLPETSVGIIPGAGGTQRMTRMLGSARALDLILHARLFAPAEALELGVVHRVFAAASFRSEVDAFARDLASRAPIALVAAKHAILQGQDVGLEDALALEQRCFDRTMRSRDAAGAMRAWLSGDTYTWKGE